MKRTRTPRIIPPRLKLASTPDLHKVIEIKSMSKGNERTEISIPISEFLTAEDKYTKLKVTIKNLEEENKKLHLENFRIKEEVNTLNKANRELTEKEIVQKKYIDRLCLEIDRLNKLIWNVQIRKGSMSKDKRIQTKSMSKREVRLVSRNKSLEYVRKHKTGL